MSNIIALETPDNLVYTFFPNTSGAFRFKVRAANDAHVALTKGSYESEPMTEIHIGGWNNTKSIVRRNRSEPDKVKVETPNILNANELVGMWIRWHSGYIAAGLEGSQSPFILYHDPSPHPIDNVAVRTGWGSTGSWEIEVSPVCLTAPTPKPLTETLRWVAMSSDDEIPPEAVIGGYEDGEVLYIARARHNRSICPGKYVPSLKKAFIPWGHRTHTKDVFEILCGHNLMWVKTNRDQIPPNAFVGGTAVETRNEDLYIGRALLDQNLIPGKVHLHYKMCYIPQGDIEREVDSYEILVVPSQNYVNMVWYPRRRRNSSGDSCYGLSHLDPRYVIAFKEVTAVWPLKPLRKADAIVYTIKFYGTHGEGEGSILHEGCHKCQCDVTHHDSHSTTTSLQPDYRYSDSDNE